MAPRQPPGAIPDGCRTASPPATWRTDPRTRQFPGAAPPPVPHGHHPSGRRRTLRMRVALCTFFGAQRHSHDVHACRLAGPAGPDL